MRFIDEATIEVVAGRGGRGIVSFRRESHVARGGPDGGDGGRGGDVVVWADPGTTTLLDHRYRHIYSAESGASGGPAGRTGRSAPELVLPLPPGTVITDGETGEILADLVEPGSALMTLRSLERAQVAFLVVDASLGFSDQDGRIANLAMEQGCAIGVLANKWDRITPGEGEALRRRLEDGLRFVSHSPILRISALRGTGTNRILALAGKLRESAHTRIATVDLNRWLHETTARHEPAMAQRGPRKRPIKFFYATQTGVGPPRFVLFCTEPASIRPTYVRFLENQLRATFGFDGTPVRLQLRARGRGKAERGRS